MEHKQLIQFCQSIKKLAKQFKTFSEFEAHCKTIKNNPLKQSDFKRLISIASVEANLA